MMANIKQPKWYASTLPVPHQSRRTIFADHDLVMNTDIPDYLRDAAVEAFEVKDGDGEFVGLVWSVPNRLVWAGATRYTRAWRAVTTDCTVVGRWKSTKTVWWTKGAAVEGLIKIYQKKRTRRRSGRTKAFMDDMAALATADL